MDSLKWLFITIKNFKNWLEIYTHRFLGSKNKDAVFALRKGYVFKAPTKEIIMPTIREIWIDMIYGDLEDLPKEPVIIDIGGHFGVFSIFGLSRRPKARVYTFEPGVDSFKYLTENIRSNNFQPGQVSLVRSAVAGDSGQREFFVSAEKPQNNSFFAQKFGEPISVKCTTLSDILKDFKIGHCDLLKIDCEGAEYEILMKSPDDVFKKIDRIILEYHEVPGYSVSDLKDFLGSKGYMVSFGEKDIRIMFAVRTA